MINQQLTIPADESLEKTKELFLSVSRFLCNDDYYKVLGIFELLTEQNSISKLKGIFYLELKSCINNTYSCDLYFDHIFKDHFEKFKLIIIKNSIIFDASGFKSWSLADILAFQCEYLRK